MADVWDKRQNPEVLNTCCFNYSILFDAAGLHIQLTNNTIIYHALRSEALVSLYLVSVSLSFSYK